MSPNLEITVSIPSEPLPEAMTEAIAEKIRDFPEISFAFLPELFIPGQMKEPALVLILVSDLSGKELAKISGKLYYEISGVFEGKPIDMLILNSDHELINPTISTGCLIEINDQKAFERCSEF